MKDYDFNYIDAFAILFPFPSNQTKSKFQRIRPTQTRQWNTRMRKHKLMAQLEQVTVYLLVNQQQPQIDMKKKTFIMTSCRADVLYGVSDCVPE